MILGFYLISFSENMKRQNKKLLKKQLNDAHLWKELVTMVSGGNENAGNGCETSSVLPYIWIF